MFKPNIMIKKQSKLLLAGVLTVMLLSSVVFTGCGDDKSSKAETEQKAADSTEAETKPLKPAP